MVSKSLCTAADITESRRRLGHFPPRCAHTASIFRLEYRRRRPAGSGWKPGAGGSGSSGAALTSPTPHVSPDMPTPAAIAAAAANLLRFMLQASQT